MAAARAALSARVLALGGRPLPGDLPVPPALGDFVALPTPFGDFPLGEATLGDLERGRPTFPLGFGATGGGGSGFTSVGSASTGAAANSGDGGELSRSGVPNRGFMGSGDFSRLTGE